MFRTALRSAASAAARRSVVATNTTSRSFSSVVSRPTLAARAVAAAPVSRVAGWNSVRCYAAGSGLSKEDVEGRITSLLAGFDKVRFYVCSGNEVSCGQGAHSPPCARGGDAQAAVVAPGAAAFEWQMMNELAGLTQSGTGHRLCLGNWLIIFLLAGERC